MPNPDAAPQRPGKIHLNLTPGQEVIEIDGFRIEQMVTSVSVRYSAAHRRPVVQLELLPSAIDIRGEGVELGGPFRDFLVAHGWRPPG